MYRVRTHLALIVVLILAPFAMAAEGTFDRTLNVNGPVDLEVNTGSGNITVRPGSATTVQVHGIVRARSSWDGLSAEEKVKRIVDNPPVSQTGNNVRIGRIDDTQLRNVSISYEITVPQATTLRSKSGSGDEQIDGIKGPVEAKSGSGGLRIRNVGSEVSASTGSGDIELSSIQGRIRASTGSGSIRGDSIGGAMNASTGSGDVTLRQSAAGDVEVSTGSGSVELDGVKGAVRAETGSGNIRAAGEPVTAWDMHTGSGSVEVDLPEQASFDLYARTSSGSIDVGFPLTMQGQVNKREVRGKVRNGGPALNVHTGSGDIRIR